MKKTLQLALSQGQLEALASGQVLVFDHPEVQLQLAADQEAVYAFNEHVFTALLANLNPLNPSMH